MTARFISKMFWDIFLRDKYGILYVTTLICFFIICRSGLEQNKKKNYEYLIISHLKKNKFFLHFFDSKRKI